MLNQLVDQNKKKIKDGIMTIRHWWTRHKEQICVRVRVCIWCSSTWWMTLLSLLLCFYRFFTSFLLLFFSINFLHCSRTLCRIIDHLVFFLVCSREYSFKKNIVEIKKIRHNTFTLYSRYIYIYIGKLIEYFFERNTIQLSYRNVWIERFISNERCLFPR